MAHGANSAAAVSTHLRKLRLAYVVSHPIQYQAPLLKRIAAEPDIDLQVFFTRAPHAHGQIDQEFGIPVEWDTPLLEGYSYEFRANRRSPESAPQEPAYSFIKRRLRAGRFDAVWIHGYHSFIHLQAIHIAHALRIPVLLRTDSTLHDRRRSPLKLLAKKLFFRWLKPNVAAILSVGNENSAYWKHYFGDQFPIFSCLYAVDNQFFQRECSAASLRREEFRRVLGLDPHRPIILFAAKLIARKRCADLIDAFVKLCHSHTVSLPYLLIVGEGKERANLQARARESMPDSIRFLGFQNQSQLPRFYDLCTVFVLPSIDEPWGLAVNEAMNAGRPVIVSNRVGCKENLVRSGVNGFIFLAGDIDALATCLRTVLAGEEVSESMCAQSLRIISQVNFDQNITGLRRTLHSLLPFFPA